MTEARRRGTSKLTQLRWESLRTTERVLCENCGQPALLLMDMAAVAVVLVPDLPKDLPRHLVDAEIRAAPRRQARWCATCSRAFTRRTVPNSAQRHPDLLPPSRGGP
jgi:hypothetical protein